MVVFRSKPLPPHMKHQCYLILERNNTLQCFSTSISNLISKVEAGFGLGFIARYLKNNDLMGQILSSLLYSHTHKIGLSFILIWQLSSPEKNSYSQ